ncbi:MAG: Sec-independent protein translocase protein TatB [Gammaproteobacteria bacterium]|nr:Sec-independent protein translocase protein TatB [Gammaproteobacteria bacterium]
MFDFGFWEMLMIVLVALVVVGPERLPGLARTVGFWVGKAKRMITEVKAEIHEELAAEELKKALDEQDLMEDVYEVIEETKKVGDEIKDEVDEVKDKAMPSIEDNSSQQTEVGAEKT